MTQVKKPMIDSEKARMNEITEARHQMLIAKHGEVIANEIERILAEMELDPQVIAARIHAEALDANTAAVQANTKAVQSLARQESITQFDHQYNRVRSELSLTHLEQQLLIVQVPEEIETIKNSWHLWEIWKDSRVDKDALIEDLATEVLSNNPDTAYVTPAARPPKRQYWGWKKHTHEENVKYIFTLIEGMFQELGKLPTSTQLFDSYQTAWLWTRANISTDWNEVIQAYIKNKSN